MESRTTMRQTLFAFVAALLGTALLCFSTQVTSRSRKRTWPRQRAAPRFSRSAHPIRDRDTAWMLTSVALVLMMTIPGLVLLLWRHGAQEERRRHRDDQLCRHMPRHDFFSRLSPTAWRFRAGHAPLSAAWIACFSRIS